MIQCYSVMARAFYRMRKEKKRVCSNVPSCSCVSLYDCLKIAADGPSVFHSPNTPSLFSKPPHDFRLLCSALSLPHPPTFYYCIPFSFLFLFQVGRQRRCRRAPKHTHKSSYSNRLFWERSTSHDWLSLVPHQLGAFNHPCKAASCCKCNL